MVKKWVENHVHDFSDVQFLRKFIVFLEEVVNADNPKWAEHLKKIVEARIIKSIVCPSLSFLSFLYSFRDRPPLPLSLPHLLIKTNRMRGKRQTT